MSIFITILLLYCAFAYGYGLSFLGECFRESLDESSEYYRADRPVFLAGTVFVLLWLLFPIVWPLFQIVAWFDKTEYFSED